MPLSFNLQRLPPEALDLLRYMGKTPGALSMDDLEEGSGLNARLIGKAVRRLVNFDYLHMDSNNAYLLTTDGERAAQQIADFDANAASEDTASNKATLTVLRRLIVVMPSALIARQLTDLYFGVNPPAPENTQLSGAVHVELKISAVGGTLTANNLSLDIPPDKAATPVKVTLLADQPGKVVRVRVDAFQASEFDSMESLGGMYFDVRIATESVVQDTTSRAVGMDLRLKPPR
ncbi:MAG: hypothetical protein ABI947_14680 [Chloroflexota bacterium]